MRSADAWSVRRWPLDSHSEHLPQGFPPDADGSQLLDPAECLQLLGGSSVGHLGFSAAALPVIFPVHYVLEGDRVLFGVGEGRTLAAARNQSVACLEVGSFEPDGRSGWGVLATGRLDVVDPQWARRVLPSTAEALRGSPQLVELPIAMVSGRRVDASS